MEQKANIIVRVFKWIWQNAIVKHPGKWAFFIVTVISVIIAVAGFDLHIEKGKSFGCSSPGLKKGIQTNASGNSLIRYSPGKLPVAP